MDPDISAIVNDDDSLDETLEGENLSSAQLLEKMEEAWKNEKMAPELLDHKMELVDVLMEQLKELEGMINQTTSARDLRIAIHLMEIDRIKYVIADYLRIRLKKIEQFAQLIVEDEVEQLKLTDGEAIFVKGYWDSIRDYLDESANRFMPENVRNTNIDRTIVRPDLSSYIFLKSNRPITGVSIQDGSSLTEEIVDFDTNDQQLVPYRSIQKLLQDGSVHLI